MHTERSVEMGNIGDDTFGLWKSIYQHLGMPSNLLAGEHGPCPFCGGKDRFHLWKNGQENNGTWTCYQCCKRGFGIDYVMKLRGVNFKDACKIVYEIIGVNRFERNKQTRPRTDEEKLEVIRNLIGKSVHLTSDTPGYKYLDSRCGPLKPERLKDMRYLADCPHPSGTKSPAIIAVVRDHNGVSTSAHRIFVDAGGGRSPIEPRKALLPGSNTSGSSVRLGEVSKTCVVAEGIETALCASYRFGCNACAAISAEGMKSWNPPEGVEHVIIAGDNDKSYTGQAAAYHLAKRLTLSGYTVQIEIPHDENSDWADHHEFIE